MKRILLVLMAAVLLACGPREVTSYGPYEVTYRSGVVDTVYAHRAIHRTSGKLLVFRNYTRRGQVSLMVVNMAEVKSCRSLNVKGRKIEV